MSLHFRLPFVALLLLGHAALAADPVGSWVVDRVALRGEFQRVMEADLAKMPPAQRAQTEAVQAGRLDELVRRAAGTAEFYPDGTLRFESLAGDPQAGRWTLEGDRIQMRIGADLRYAGTLDGGSMRLEPQGEVDPAPELLLKRP